MEEENSITEPPPTIARSRRSLIVYVLGISGTSVGFFHCSSEEFFVVETACVPLNFVAGQLYNLQWARCGRAIFCELPELTQDVYLDRHAFAHADYEGAVLRGLLLHCRVRDFHQRAARVVSCSQENLALVMPNIPGPIPPEISFRTEWGEVVDLAVDQVVRDSRCMQLFCTPMQQLTSGLSKNSFLELDSGNLRVAIATRVMDEYLHRRRTINDPSFLSRVYGEEASFVNRRVSEALFHLRDRDRRTLILTPAQSEAISRYKEEDCPGFVVEGASLTGKATIIAAMALTIARSSRGDLRGLPPLSDEPGEVQLIVGSDLATIRELAELLEALDVMGLDIISISETDYGSAFSVADSPDAENNEALARPMAAKELLRYASRSEAEQLLQQLPLLHRAAVRAAVAGRRRSIILVTIEDVLHWLMQDAARHCPMQQLLQSATRIILPNAHGISEAQLNAIALLYSNPGVKIVGVGDRSMIPPRRNSVVDQLGGVSALEVMMRKRNLPIIKLTRVFGEEDAANWQEPEPEVQLAAIFRACRSDSNRLFVEVRASHAIPSGKSLINDHELSGAEFVIGMLKQRGVEDHKVLVVALHTAQVELAKTRLPLACEVISLEDAESRIGHRRDWKDITIILTTGDERHGSCQELFARAFTLAASIDTAVIILGSISLRTTDPWKELLREQHFDHLSC